MPSDILFFHNLITFDCTLRISINAGYFIRYPAGKNTPSSLEPQGEHLESDVLKHTKKLFKISPF